MGQHMTKTNKMSYICNQQSLTQPWPHVMKFFFMLNSTEHEFNMLIDIKMSIIIGMLTYISRINITSDSFKARKISIFPYFSFMNFFMLNPTEHEVYLSNKC